jgi:hypothetical protein
MVCFDLNGFTRRLRRCDHGFCGKIERNAEHVGVFHVEETGNTELMNVNGLSKLG